MNELQPGQPIIMSENTRNYFAPSNEPGASAIGTVKRQWDEFAVEPLFPTTNAKFEYDMLKIMEDLINNGVIKGDRTGTGTHSKLGNVLRVDISDNKAPLMFSKEIKYKSFLVETDWFLKGHTNIAYLKQFGVGIWDEWVIPETAVFRPYTEDEYAKAKVAFLKALDFPADHELAPGVCVMGYKDLFNYYRCTYPDHYKKWKKEFPTGSDLVALREYIMKNLPVDLINFNDIPCVKLLDGSIGTGAYGSLWRNWEDTRIVEAKEAQKFYDRGYSFVADVPLGSNWKKEAGQPQKEFVVISRNIDQIANAIELLKKNPESRRIIVSAWNPGRIEDAVLPPCHSLFSFWTRDLTFVEMYSQLDLLRRDQWEKWRTIPIADLSEQERHDRNFNELVEFIHYINDQSKAAAAADNSLAPLPLHTKALSCLLYMRSNDTALGMPFNIPQYALLTQVIAQCVGMATDELVYIGADSHLYLNHVEEAKKQTTEPYVDTEQPRFLLDPNLREINQFTWESVRVVNYRNYGPNRYYPIAV